MNTIHSPRKWSQKKIIEWDKIKITKQTKSSIEKNLLTSALTMDQKIDNLNAGISQIIELFASIKKDQIRTEIEIKKISDEMSLIKKQTDKISKLDILVQESLERAKIELVMNELEMLRQKKYRYGPIADRIVAVFESNNINKGIGDTRLLSRAIYDGCRDIVELVLKHPKIVVTKDDIALADSSAIKLMLEEHQKDKESTKNKATY